MPDTLIGAGKTLDNLTIGLDTIVWNESAHWFIDPETKRLYSKCKVVKTGTGYEIYLTGEPQINVKRESYDKGDNENGK